MTPVSAWQTYDQFFYALVAVAGTAAAASMVFRVMTRSKLAPWVHTLHGVVPPFLNVIGVLFALTLAFLANDTWSAHDRAVTAVYREADALHTLKVLAAQLPEPHGSQLRLQANDYARRAAAEWTLLAHRSASNEVTTSADRLLTALAQPALVTNADAQLRALMLQKAVEIREERDKRIALSQTHVNPLKWLGMAFLGLVTLLSVAVVHIEHPRAAATALVLFALSSAPTAAIVLAQGNPFQQPTGVSPAPLLGVLAERG